MKAWAAHHSLGAFLATDPAAAKAQAQAADLRRAQGLAGR